MLELKKKKEEYFSQGFQEKNTDQQSKKIVTNMS